MRTGQPRLGLAAFSHVGPAQAHRQPCQRPRGVIPSLGQKEHSSCIRPVAMPGRFRLDDRVACVRNNNAMGQRHAGKISKVRRTVRIAPGARVDFAHRSPRARATTARTTTATSPCASTAFSTLLRAAL